MTIQDEKPVFTVSQLNRKVKQLLELHLPLIWVSGEISNLAQPSSGHWYFSLKDDSAQIRCAMFRQANSRLRWQPQSGKQVLVRGRVSIYEGRGEYQLIVEHMEDAGTGALQRAYEALKLKLLQEGLFADEHKQELPLFPQHIGVITSPTGAAIHDILTVLQRRYPIAEVTVVPSMVQGEGAAATLLDGLNKAERFGRFDLLIIGRGGGSLEDLWAFNDEALARAIFACRIPIISAVGHEVDFTICDFVADIRAPTPSASAEIATPDLIEWQQTLDTWYGQLLQQMRNRLLQFQQQLAYLQRRLRHPGEQLKAQAMRLQKAQAALRHSFSQHINTQQKQLTHLQHRLQQQHPQHRIQLLQRQTKQWLAQLHQLIRHQLFRKKQALSAQCQLLDAVSPLAVLGRGYSIVTNQDGSIVQSANQINVGDKVYTQLATGGFDSQITALKTEQNNN